MPVAWYIVPYVRINPPRNGQKAHRAVALDVDWPQLEGKWREIEVLGDRAIVKINADVSTLLQLNAVYKRILVSQLGDPISTLSAAARTALRNEILDMGYTLQELNQRLPNPIGTYTLRDVLEFMRTRRKKVDYDAQTDSIIFTDEDQPCGDIDALDRVIT